MSCWHAETHSNLIRFLFLFARNRSWPSFGWNKHGELILQVLQRPGNAQIRCEWFRNLKIGFITVITGGDSPIISECWINFRTFWDAILETRLEMSNGNPSKIIRMIRPWIRKKIGILTHLHSDFPLTSLDHICSRLEQSYQCPGVCWCTDVTMGFYQQEWWCPDVIGNYPLVKITMLKNGMWHTLIHCNFNKNNCWSTIGFVWGCPIFGLLPTWCKNMCKNGSKTMFLIHSLRQIYRISPYLCRIFTSVSLIPKAMCNFPAVEKPWQTRHSELVPNPNRSDSHLAFRRSKHELSIHERWFPDSIENLRLGQRRELLYPEVPSRIPGPKNAKTCWKNHLYLLINSHRPWKSAVLSGNSSSKSYLPGSIFSSTGA